MIGAQGIATIDFSSPWQSISKTTILEERAQVLVNQSDSLSVEYRPFEIITLVMREQE
jgi:alpha-mannosidase